MANTNRLERIGMDYAVIGILSWRIVFNWGRNAVSAW